MSVSWSCFMFGEMIEEMMMITACGNYVTADDETRPVSLVSRSLPERKQFSTYQLVHCMDGGPMPLADTPPSPPTSRAGHKAHWTRGNSGQDDAVLGFGIVNFLVFWYIVDFQLRAVASRKLSRRTISPCRVLLGPQILPGMSKMHDEGLA